MRMLTLSHASDGSPGSTPPSPRTVATETTDMTTTVVESSPNNINPVTSVTIPTQSIQRPLSLDEIKMSMGTSVQSSISSGVIRKPRAATFVTSRGPAVNSWESVATSWILPDGAQVIWRVVLATGLFMTFIIAMEEHPDSVRAFSINAYRSTSLAAIALLIPCAAALTWPDDDTLDSKFGTVVWATIVTILVFATAFIMTMSTAYIILTPHSEINWRHLSLVTWLILELVVGSTRVLASHALVAMVMCAMLLLGIAFFGQDPLWLNAFSPLGRPFAYLITAAVFVLWTGFIMGIVTGRCLLTDALQRYRDEAELDTNADSGDKGGYGIAQG